MMATEGYPGEPGEPGEPGGDGGGAGGRGGRGGRGGKGATTHANRTTAVVMFVLLVAIALSIATLIQTHHIESNADAIAALERKDAKEQRMIGTALTIANYRQDEQIVNARKAAYRICLRQQVVRAAMALDSLNDEPKLPLYHCEPNLSGGQAQQMSPKQEQAFLRYVRDTPKNKLP